LILVSLLLGGIARRRGLVLVVVVDDLQDLDEAERGAEAAKGRLQLGVDLGHLAMMPAVSVAHSPRRGDATRLLGAALAAVSRLAVNNPWPGCGTLFRTRVLDADGSA
jgi:hypothetical protein